MNQANPLQEYPDITNLLQAWGNGDEEAWNRLTTMIVDDLRKRARYLVSREYAPPLDPTELVNEAYLKLMRHPPKHWGNRIRFYGVFVKCMKQVLVDLSRERAAAKRGANAQDKTLITVPGSTQSLTFTAFLDALEELRTEDERKARVLELRILVGLSVAEVAELLEIAEPTVKRDFKHARMFLYEQVHGDDEPYSSKKDKPETR